MGEPIEKVSDNYPQEVKDELIEIVKASFNGDRLTNRQICMLVFWVRHKTDPNFQFIKDALHLDDNYEMPKPKKKRRYYRHNK